MNPALKTLLTIAAGGAAAGADTLLTTLVPTGGFAHTLSSQPVLATLFAAGIMYAHNFFSKLEAQAGIHPAQTGGQ